jgi:hypothetical protein
MYRQARTPSSIYTRKPVLSASDGVVGLRARPILPTSDIGLMRSPPNHSWEVMVRETLRIVRMLRPVVADEVVRQLVAERDPPVRHGLHQPIRTVHAAPVQLLKVSQVAEDAAVSVESDGGALLVRENVDCRYREVEDGRAAYEEGVERCDGALVVCVEGLGVGRVAGEEEFHSLVEVSDECKVVAWSAVAVRWRLFDLVRFWA